MKKFNLLGKDFVRKDAILKTTGNAKYTNDSISPDLLYVALVTSKYAHANIKSINTKRALNSEGVRAILIGKDYPYLTGGSIEDRPVIAIDKVRYFGEVVAVIVANTYEEALRAKSLVEVEYEPLKVVNSIKEAKNPKYALVHEHISEYKIISQVYPENNTNIANLTKIRKGIMDKGWKESEVIVEENYYIPQSDHVAMETHSCIVEITRDNKVIIESSTQGPFTVAKDLAYVFNIDSGKITVKAPFVGGAFGGKTPTMLEFIGYLASKAVGGRKVKITNTREEDMVTSPDHIGLEAKVKLGCTENGHLKAAEISYFFDGGAYSDRAVRMSMAAACDCTGPYNIENVYCDSFCMYTNHPYATSFRGFSHGEYTFAIERTMDILANKLNMDPLELRFKNAIQPGDTSPTQQKLTRSNLGSLSKCIEKLWTILANSENDKVITKNNKVIETGISCFWKSSTTPTNAGGGAILTFNSDGSININCPVVEIGQGTKSNIAQIVAQKFKMEINKINIIMEVNTQSSPNTWKTAASRSMLLVGRAVLNAVDDAITQLKKTASIVLRCLEEDLDLENGKVFLKGNKKVYVNIKDIALGYTYPNGNAICGQVIGRGSYISRGLTYLNPNTGKGSPGMSWTVGAQAVKIELDTRTFQYRVLKAITVIDAGRVINPKIDRGQITGGMCMGISWATRENYIFDDKGIVLNHDLRLYKTIRYGEQPEYIAEFIEIPNDEMPYGTRSISEHGILGMPAALGNCFSNILQVKINKLPLTPENLWKEKMEVRK